MIKQLKNRYADLNKPLRFVVGIDRSKMRLYDVEEAAQKNILQSEKEMTSEKQDMKEKFRGFK